MMIPILASLLIVIIIIIVSQRDGFDQTFNFFQKASLRKKIPIALQYLCMANVVGMI